MLSNFSTQDKKSLVCWLYKTDLRQRDTEKREDESGVACEEWDEELGDQSCLEGYCRKKSFIKQQKEDIMFRTPDSRSR